MDPTQMQGGLSPAIQNALMLQAIKAGAMGGGAAPSAATSAATGSPQLAPSMPPATPPIDPSTMMGGVGSDPNLASKFSNMPFNPNAPQAPMSNMPFNPNAPQAPMQPLQNPVANALMSPIPGMGGQ